MHRLGACGRWSTDGEAVKTEVSIRPKATSEIFDSIPYLTAVKDCKARKRKYELGQLMVEQEEVTKYINMGFLIGVSQRET